MVNPSEMYLLQVEGGAATRCSRSVPADDAMRRQVPIRRNRFDNFIFEATQWAMDEGGSNSFSFACQHLRAARDKDAAAAGEPVPLVPLTVTRHVDQIVTQWRPIPQAPWAIDLPDEEAQLCEELYLSLGGDLGDGLGRAGRRLYSRMWSARIADGFVHPAVGAVIWNSNWGSNRGDDADAGGPLIAAVYDVGEMWGRWWNEPEHRPDIEREIVDLAHALGW